MALPYEMNSFARGLATLPLWAKGEYVKDLVLSHRSEISNQEAVRAVLGWLENAQDFSASSDGGVARHFSLVEGWGPSYPETTGYIVPTILDCARILRRPDLRERARKMLDFLVAVQFPNGGFPGGPIGAKPWVPVVFNTGQILLGLAAGVRDFGETYSEPMRRAAGWLVDIQDSDGCWRSNQSPFAASGDKSYDAHVAWGMFEAAAVSGDPRFLESAVANIRWVLTQQNSNGWFRNCCLTDREGPLTHTIGYTLRGVVEGFRHAEDERFLHSALRASEGILGALRPDGFLPGRLDSSWNPMVSWSCLTGSVQIATCWFILAEMTGKKELREGAELLNGFVRRTIDIGGRTGIRGGIRGSLPIYGGYGTGMYLNWAAKFAIDAFLIEDGLVSA